MNGDPNGCIVFVNNQAFISIKIKNIALDGLCKIRNNMSDFKTRLVSEQVELDEKLKKLNDFNQSEKVNEIDPVQKDLLLIQAGAMYTYNECLKARLARL